MAEFGIFVKQEQFELLKVLIRDLGETQGTTIPP